jgi:hypothetical protein
MRDTSYDLVRDDDGYIVVYSPSRAEIVSENPSEHEALVQELLLSGARIFSSFKEWYAYAQQVRIEPSELEDENES